MRAQKRSTTLIVMFLFQRCACLPVLDPSKAAMASTRTLSGKTPLRNLVSAELSSSSGSEDDSAIEPVKVPVAKRGGEYIRSTSPSASNVEKVVTLSLIALWYAASVVCNQTSKNLLQKVAPQTLTLAQMTIAAASGAFCLFAVKLAPFDGIASLPHLRDTALLAAIYSTGFALLNSCMGAMHVSMAMTLRAAEPLTTLLVGGLLANLPRHRQKEQGGGGGGGGGGGLSTGLTSPARLASLVVVVSGCALSAVGAHGPTQRGVVLAMASNVCFSLRGVLGKSAFTASRGRPKMGPYSLFFHLAWLGVLLQLAVMAAKALVLVPKGLGLAAAAALPPVPPTESLGTLLVNGVSFFAYLQLSWVVLGRMTPVSHSLANSLRRPATIAAALAFAPAPMSALNYAGIATACAGALLYGFLH